MFLYFGFMISTLLLLRAVRRRARDDPWFFFRSMAIQVGLTGTMSAAMFSNRLYGESIYWMCALAFTLYRLQVTELEGVETEKAATRSEPAGEFAPFGVPSAGGVRAR